MEHVSELIINKNEVTKEDFLGLYNAISGHLGTLKKVRFHILLRDNHVRYFVESDKDLGTLTSSVHFAVLQPAKKEDIQLPSHTKRERFVNFNSGGNLLNMQEKLSVKRGKVLEHFVCDVRKVNFEYAKVNMLLYFKDAAGQYSLAIKKSTNFPAHLFEINFDTSNNIMRTEPPKYLNIEKILHTIMPENLNALLEVNTYPYFPKPYYLPLPSYEFDKHSLIVGASGSGKSKFIELFLDRLNRLPSRYNYRAIVIDPHANLANDLRNIENTKVIDFNGETTELFAGAEADVTAATELTATLMKSLIGDAYNPRVERVLRFSLFVMFSAQSMSLGMLKRFLTELELRQQILDHVQGHVPQNITHFFATDFNELRTAHYKEALLPIVSLVDELELQPALLGEGGVSLQDTINSNFLTVFSLNKVSMGEKVVKTVAGLLIQQVFLLAQSRAFNERILLFIDEVSVVQNPALSAILSEARKFNLFVVLTQQYLTQVDKSLKDAIFANVSNYYCFRVAEEDALQLVGNLPMELPNEMLHEAKEKGVKEETLKVRMLTDLHPRECVVRIASGGLLLPCFRARTLDIVSDATKTAMGDNFNPVAYTEKPVVLSKFEENTAPKTYESLDPVSTEQAPQTTATLTEVPAATMPKVELIPQEQIVRLSDQPIDFGELTVQLQDSQPPPGQSPAPPGPEMPPPQYNPETISRPNPEDMMNNQAPTQESNGKETLQ